MRSIIPSNLEEGRIKDGPFGSDSGELWGAFFITSPLGRQLKIMSSGHDLDYRWEHVSVSLNSRPPSWAEMCYVKDLFWREDECVVQFHPPRSEYVNHHPYCLHLWKPIDIEIPLPPTILVGPQKGQAS